MTRNQQVERVRNVLPEARGVAVTTADELEHEEHPPVIVPERFVIDDAQKASWAVRKIVEAREYGERDRRAGGAGGMIRVVARSDLASA
jgi:hypothetical protein